MSILTNRNRCCRKFWIFSALKLKLRSGKAPGITLEGGEPLMHLGHCFGLYNLVKWFKSATRYKQHQNSKNCIDYWFHIVPFFYWLLFASTLRIISGCQARPWLLVAIPRPVSVLAISRSPRPWDLRLLIVSMTRCSVLWTWASPWINFWPYLGCDGRPWGLCASRMGIWKSLRYLRTVLFPVSAMTAISAAESLSTTYFWWRKAWSVTRRCVLNAEDIWIFGWRIFVSTLRRAARQLGLLGFSGSGSPHSMVGELKIIIKHKHLEA